MWAVSIAFAQTEYVQNVVVLQFKPNIAYKTNNLPEFDRIASRYQVYLTERVYPFLDYVEPTPKIRRNLLALRRTYYVRYHANVAPEQVAKDLNHLSEGRAGTAKDGNQNRWRRI